jgi:tRNA U34 2-thiouridine synthase MnmA/TrmU
MKAIALASGGLDSTLATRLIKEQGVEIVILNFKTPFCLCDRKGSSGCGNKAVRLAQNLGVRLKVIYVTDEYFEIIKNPRYGYGSNMNPCIDCRILLFRKAKELMQEIDASFVVTGEVLGQRPMSQHKRALKIIEKESGLEGLVVRPLSARLLPETIPEKKGWIQRERLLNFSGRTRRPQMALAELFQIKDYPCSSGGCLLTEPNFSKRIKDLLECGELTLSEVELLKIGRHFRLLPNAKLVVGRNESENERLSNMAKKGDYLFFPQDVTGPLALGRGDFNKELIELSCSIICRYCDLNGTKSANISYKKMGIVSLGDRPLRVSPVDEERLMSIRI